MPLRPLAMALCMPMHSLDLMVQSSFPFANIFTYLYLLDYEERAFKGPTDQDDNKEDFYGNEADEYAAGEGSQEPNWAIQPNAPFNQDFEMNGPSGQEYHGPFDPTHYYYQEGVGLVAIEQSDTECIQNSTQATSLRMNDEDRLLCKA